MTIEQLPKAIIEIIESNINEKFHAVLTRAPELLLALKWCEQTYGADWPEDASIKQLIREAEGA